MIFYLGNTILFELKWVLKYVSQNPWICTTKTSIFENFQGATHKEPCAEANAALEAAIGSGIETAAPYVSTTSRKNRVVSIRLDGAAVGATEQLRH